MKVLFNYRILSLPCSLSLVYIPHEGGETNRISIVPDVHKHSIHRVHFGVFLASIKHFCYLCYTSFIGLFHIF